MKSICSQIYLAQHGNKEAEAALITRYEPVINKFAKLNGIVDEDCKQQMTIAFILAIRRFDLSRYK